MVDCSARRRAGQLIQEQGGGTGERGKQDDGECDPEPGVPGLGAGVRAEQVVVLGRMIEIVRELRHAVARVNPLEDFDRIPVLVHSAQDYPRRIKGF